MLLVGVAVLVVVSVALIGYSVLAGRMQHREIIQSRLQDRRQGSVKTESETSAGRWFKEKAAPVLAKAVKPRLASDQSNLRIKLANAGIRGESSPVVFLASKLILAGVLLVLSLVVSIGAGHEKQKIFGIAVFATGLGFLLPDLWLMLARKSRGELIKHGLPDCLDLMVVSVEAGLGLDAALQRVSQEMSNVHSELAEEFMLANMEVQMGITRSEALENLALRTAVPEVKALTAILIQVEKFGTSIANALRVHADALRVKRRQEAEERAAKTAVKLVIPLILFIFPAIFVVLAGPAMLKLWQTLSSGILMTG